MINPILAQFRNFNMPIPHTNQHGSVIIRCTTVMLFKAYGCERSFSITINRNTENASDNSLRNLIIILVIDQCR